MERGGTKSGRLEGDIQLRHPGFDESFLLEGDESVFELISLGLVVSYRLEVYGIAEQRVMKCVRARGQGTRR